MKWTVTTLASASASSISDGEIESRDDRNQTKPKQNGLKVAHSKEKTHARSNNTNPRWIEELVTWTANSIKLAALIEKEKLNKGLRSTRQTHQASNHTGQSKRTELCRRE
eukprot:c19472_g2_i2.p3 GENE.c19472_g2_i2~~c19472_g2_i2.p3  ORF type:complete len:110 (-),score=20.37 c19472_g2_i2:870-1199(-)